MKRTRIFTALLAAALLLIATSCGTSDSLKSLLLTSNGTNNSGFYNLPGVDATLQLKVFAVYHSGKMVEVTNDSTWNVVPVGCASTAENASYLCPVPASQTSTLPPYGPDTVPINKTGLMTGIVQMCTWTDALVQTTSGCPNGQSTCQIPASPPIWLYTGYYQTTATYRNLTSQPVGIGVGVTASDDFAGCGPS